MEKLNSKLSRVSEDFGALLDKALSEPEFRWQLLTNKDEIIALYGIKDQNDIKVFDEILEKLKAFVKDRAQEQGEFIKYASDQNKKYNRTNPDLEYEQALLKR